MSTVQDLASTCPYCGSHDVIRTVPEQNASDVIIVCIHCHRAVLPGSPSPRTQVQAKKAITDQVVDLCLNHGLIHGVRFYYTEMNKLGGPEVNLLQAKQDVDTLLASRGLTHAIKKPSKNGCVVVLIVLLLIVASVVYFFLSHHG
ncbi:MAG: hypothetical protein JO154_07460 [Chitinophaga sp.]|uniref:hypothetical protein n=1 Tax=Chitinophaga sp. TaxID=1869181 RepID=UPI0025B8A2A5|nr:hypothetical protein [Chitinophaga sp.]MBV8252429.1 hypothetical protein [Chitinophaga sp.]